MPVVLDLYSIFDLYYLVFLGLCSGSGSGSGIGSGEGTGSGSGSGIGSGWKDGSLSSLPKNNSPSIDSIDNIDFGTTYLPAVFAKRFP
ncbi:hypothetical protein MSHOH_1290 [Methanosarcina horonobensis HB-1 = JCM 15518]|uniref:Uncharacterized protein n=1 Tax=Methanosarcina horonobensis HB-1 = JCM 15518 TaxID=1434110 RepID=A0A0E3SE61_9EURY|nr:hypothetical protein [Methanosarcina horonobensis]AKB77773.1 hypothetical protein MSHOH_1290 [Methanosarcina horonobensis HB-1 = JCM 15518]